MVGIRLVVGLPPNIPWRGLQSTLVIFTFKN
jgi:hypothetical protein